MTALDQILKEDMESQDHISIMLDDNEGIDSFISDLEAEELESEICPLCGKSLIDCECEDSSEEYYYEEELPDELNEIDDSLYEFAEVSSKKSNALNEAYFGKTKEILECQSLLGAIRQKYSGSAYNIKINTDPLLLEFNEKIANIFGLYCYELYIQAGLTYNAYTMPISYAIDYNPKKALANKNGFKYDKAAKYSVMTVIYQGLMFSDKFTDAEIMAILLHEMGHNFSSVVDGDIRTMNMALIIYSLLVDIKHILNNLIHLTPAMAPMAIKNVLFDIDTYIRKNIKPLYYINGIFDDISAIIGDIVNNISGVIDFATFGTLRAGLKILDALRGQILSLIVMSYKYKDEKIADSISTAYGYSQDLQSALYKMEQNEGGIITKKVLKDIPLIGAVQGVLEIPSYAIVYALDEHPVFIERSNSSIKLLERELSKSNLDPKMRKVIENDLDQLKKKQKELLDSGKGLKDNMYAKKIYWSWLLGNFDGDIKHNIFDSDYVTDKLDSSYNRAQERNTEINKVKLI
jgi:Zn-dependent protease with chaperone function